MTVPFPWALIFHRYYKKLFSPRYRHDIFNIKRIDIILQRIKDNLALNYNLEEQLRDVETGMDSDR